MTRRLSILLLLSTVTIGESCLGDDFIIAPGPSPTETSTLFPFLLNQTPGPEPFGTMRYQQVYNASLFANVDTRSIYLTTLTFEGVAEEFGAGTRVRSIQINLSTTSRGADSLSAVFSENVGLDDTTVFGPASCGFPGGLYDFPQLVLLDRPFRYNPGLGGLLLDVRIFDSGGFVDPLHPIANVAYYSPTDSVSRVWATNVTSAVADGADSTGLSTVIRLSPVPSLRAVFFPVYFGYFTNIIRISWPSQPSTFMLQRAEKLGPNALWQAVTNQIEGTPESQERWINLPAASAGSMGYYRLVWPHPRSAQ